MARFALQLTLVVSIILLASGGEDGIVFKVSPTTATYKSIINVTCGARVSDPARRIYRIHVTFPNEPPMMWEMLPRTSYMDWSCVQMISAADGLKLCRTPAALLVKLRAQPKHIGQVNCTVFTGPEKEDVKPSMTSVTKTIKVDVRWTSRIHHMWMDSNSIGGAQDVVVPGPANVSCRFLVRPKGDKPKMSSHKSWKTIDNSTRVGVWGYPTALIQKRKIVTVADNGTKISCSVGNSSITKVLTVMIPPKILNSTLDVNGTVTVGNKITCAAEAIPTPEVFIICAQQPVLYSEGKGRASITLPMDMMPKAYDITCRAKNAGGITRKNWRINVKKLPMPLTLHGVEPQPVGSVLNISCGTVDPDAKQIAIGIYRLWELDVQSRKISYLSLLGPRKVIKNFPYTFGGTTIYKVGRSNAITASIRLQRTNNGTAVRCFATDNAGKEMEKVRYLTVMWQPAVEGFKMMGTFNPGSQVIKLKKVILRCTVQLGSPPISIAQVRAAVGNRDLGRALSTNALPILKGVRRTIVSWEVRLSQGQNGMLATCRIVNGTKVLKANSTTIQVHYKPSIVDFAPRDKFPIVFGDRIRCATDANPPAVVVLSFRRESEPWEEVSRGLAITSTMTKIEQLKPGRHFVRCEAVNSVGYDEERWQIVVLKTAPTALINVSTDGAASSISCSTDAASPLLGELRMFIRPLGLGIGRTALSPGSSASSTAHFLAPGTSTWRIIPTLPFVVHKGITVELLAAKQNRIDIRIVTSTSNRNTKILCRALDSEGRAAIASVERQLNDSQPPQLRGLQICLRQKDIFKTRPNAIILTGQVESVKPEKPLRSVVLLINGFGTPALVSQLKPMKYDGEGNRWLQATWTVDVESFPLWNSSIAINVGFKGGKVYRREIGTLTRSAMTTKKLIGSSNFFCTKKLI